MGFYGNGQELCGPLISIVSPPDRKAGSAGPCRDIQIPTLPFHKHGPGN